MQVSVPVRGFSQWKLASAVIDAINTQVSVPVRGFSQWKHFIKKCGEYCDLYVSVPVRGFSQWKRI